MVIQLYGMDASAPCRTVALVAAAVDAPLELVITDVRNKDHLHPDFIKKNPQHTVPTIVDGDFSLWESRAIARYLVNKYAPGSPLYPQDARARAIVDQRLDFDLSTLYSNFGKYFYPIIMSNAEPDEANLKKLEESLGFLNTFLEGRKYAAGSNLTIADLSLVATVSTIDAVGISLDEFPNVKKWFELVKQTAPKYKEVNEKGIESFKELLASFKKA